MTCSTQYTDTRASRGQQALWPILKIKLYTFFKIWLSYYLQGKDTEPFNLLISQNFQASLKFQASLEMLYEITFPVFHWGSLAPDSQRVLSPVLWSHTLQSHWFIGREMGNLVKNPQVCFPQKAHLPNSLLPNLKAGELKRMKETLKSQSRNMKISFKGRLRLLLTAKHILTKTMKAGSSAAALS